MKTTLGYHDGWLCVQHEDMAFTEPNLITNYWPIERCAREHVQDILGTGIISEGNGRYRMRTLQGWRSFACKDAGKTLPIHTTVEPIPRPNTKVPTRWEPGTGWQKYLKSRGWVTV